MSAEPSDETAIKVWPRAVLVISAIAAFVLVASRASYVPIWDGRTYADCIVGAADAPRTPDAFRCIGHTSQAFIALAALVQTIDEGNATLLIALNGALFVLSAVGFGRLIRLCFPDEDARPDRELLTAAFIVQPAFLSSVVQPSIDLPLLPQFLWCMVFLWRRQMKAVVAIGILMAFTKETGLLLYAVLVGSFAFHQLRTDRAPPWDRMKSVLRLAPLSLPAVVFAGYLAVRAATHSGPLIGTTANTGSSFLGQFLTPRLDLYLINFLVLTLVLNFAWVATVPIGLDAFVGLVRRAHKLARRPLGSADKSVIEFVLTVLIAVGVALSRFITYGNIRYYLGIVALLPIVLVATLHRFGIPPRWRSATLGAYGVLLLASNVRTLDPLSRTIYGTFAFGEHRLLRMTRITDECCGNGQDQLAYNLQFTALGDVVDDALGTLLPKENPHIILPDSTAWFQIGPLDSASHRRTLRRHDTVRVPIVEVAGAVADSGRPQRAIYLALPNGQHERGLADLRRVYDFGPERRVEQHGYQLFAWDLTRRDEVR
jgi:hypothetical protein